MNNTNFLKIAEIEKENDNVSFNDNLEINQYKVTVLYLTEYYDFIIRIVSKKIKGHINCQIILKEHNLNVIVHPLVNEMISKINDDFINFIKKIDKIKKDITKSIFLSINKNCKIFKYENFSFDYKKNPIYKMFNIRQIPFIKYFEELNNDLKSDIKNIENFKLYFNDKKSSFNKTETILLKSKKYSYDCFDDWLCKLIHYEEQYINKEKDHFILKHELSISQEQKVLVTTDVFFKKFHFLYSDKNSLDIKELISKEKNKLITKIKQSCSDQPVNNHLRVYKINDEILEINIKDRISIKENTQLFLFETDNSYEIISPIKVYTDEIDKFIKVGDLKNFSTDISDFLFNKK